MKMSAIESDELLTAYAATACAVGVTSDEARAMMREICRRLEAADDLLEACKSLLAYGEYTPRDIRENLRLYKARAAIDTAKGE